MPRLKPIIAGNNAAARFALFWLLMVTVHVAHAQNQANNWYFGYHAGITFNSGNPVALTDGAINTREGCSTISNAAGDILFYSDGVQAWNKNHVQMQNGFGLLGDPSSTQSSIIVPKPGSARYYYLFTVPAWMPNNGLCYSLVDMNLAGGLGGIAENEKNILLQAAVAEKVTAVRHSNNTDIWVITHERDNDVFDAFLITSAGINPIPVKSTVGVVIPSNGLIGYLKSSPDGTHLALANLGGANCCEVFNFNTSTGKLTNPVRFTQNIAGPYGIEFSPNSLLLYISMFNNGKIYQADVSSGDSATIISSLLNIASPGGVGGALQLGVDGKIYTATENNTNLNVIPHPDIAGEGCGFIYNEISLAGKIVGLGLPTFIQSYFNPVPFTYKNVCFGDTTEFIPEITTGIDSVLWNFGDPASVPNDTSSLFSPMHVFTAPGTFSVSLTSWAGGVSATETQDVKINPLPQPLLGADTTLCGGNALILNAGEGYTAYLWNDGTTGKNLLVTTNGTYTVTVTDGNGCLGSDGIQVEFHVVPGPVLIRHDE